VKVFLKMNDSLCLQETEQNLLYVVSTRAKKALNINNILEEIVSYTGCSIH
jgi:hypothetical protein